LLFEVKTKTIYNNWKHYIKYITLNVASGCFYTITLLKFNQWTLLIVLYYIILVTVLLIFI